MAGAVCTCTNATHDGTGGKPDRHRCTLQTFKFGFKTLLISRPSSFKGTDSVVEEADHVHRTIRLPDRPPTAPRDRTNNSRYFSVLLCKSVPCNERKRAKGKCEFGSPTILSDGTVKIQKRRESAQAGSAQKLTCVIKDG